MDIEAVQKSYARWAPVYDNTFGAATNVGRRRAARRISTFGGTVLEVGVGTGLALEHYSRNVRVTGIDFSTDMLGKARQKVDRLGLGHVAQLLQMDARALEFPANHFDTVTAMHLVSVVPEPEKVIREMARVCKPGGRVVIVNHFARDKGFLAALERLTAPLENLLGWHSDFEKSRVLGAPGLQVEEDHSFPPLGMMTFLMLRKEG